MPNFFNDEFADVGVGFWGGGSLLRSYDLTAPDATGLALVTIAEQNSAWLQLAINARATAGGYIYFPAGTYYFGRSSVRPDEAIPTEEFGDIIVPPNITLWFAPGAMLVPLTGIPRGRGQLPYSESWKVRIEILGDIVAERRQIFATDFDLPIMLNGVELYISAGRILLAGSRIPEVYPEWWGAVPETLDAAALAIYAPKTRKAIQAAIDAAYHSRTTRFRESAAGVSLASDIPPPRLDSAGAIVWNRRSSIPIVLTGVYQIDGELVIGVDQSWTPETANEWTQPPTAGFSLEGGHGISAPSIQAVGDPAHFVGNSILAIRGPLGFSITNVTFDANYVASRCVSVEPIEEVLNSTEFEGCEFGKARSTLVVLDAESRRLMTPPTTPARLTDFWNIAFTRCRFITGSHEEVSCQICSGNIPDIENNLICVDVRLADNAGLEFRTCWFRGPVSPSIRAFSGRFAMNESLTHHTRPRHISVPCAPHSDADPACGGSVAPSGVNPLWSQNDYSHGCDIMIAAPDATTGLAAANGVSLLVPAAFTIREHQSHSWQLCASKNLNSSPSHALQRSAYIILNAKLKLETQTGPIGAQEFLPPAIFWPTNGPGASPLNCPLVMIGCQFPGPGLPATGAPATSGVVVVGRDVQGFIFNIGTHLFNDEGALSAVLQNSVRSDSPEHVLGDIVRQLRALPVGG